MPHRQAPALPCLSNPDASLPETLTLLEQRQRMSRRHLVKGLCLSAMFASPLKALACAVIPSETEGPYPADGSNGPNVLTQSGIVRSDIRSSFGSAGTAVAGGEHSHHTP